MFTRSKFILAGVFIAGLTACGGGGGGSGSPAVVVVPLDLTLPTSYTLKWSDDFSTPGQPSNQWTYDLGATLLGGSVWGNAEKEYYTAQAKNSYIDSNGQLVIQPVAGISSADMTNSDNLADIQSRGVVATSARLTTNTSAYFSALNSNPYGFYEIRAQIPCVYGAWPALWMMGRTGDWPARGEIDIMEWFGAYFASQPNQVQSGVHTPANSGSSSLFAKNGVANMCGAFHKFQLHWSASEILIGVDGVPTFSYKKPANASASNWPFSQPAYILLNVAVGGNLGGSVNLGDIPNMGMKVDYVKVWQPSP